MNKSFRAKAMAVHAHKNLSAAFRNERGAFDMPSIIIGVIVVGILTAGVLATVFGVVPFAQDKAAQQDLSAIGTAQGTYYAQSTEVDKIVATNESKVNSYAGAADLNTGGLLPKMDAAKILVEGGTTGWVAISLSNSGKAFYATSAAPAPVELTGTHVDAEAAMTAAKAKAPVVDLGVENS